MNTEHTNQSRQAEPATHSPIALQSIPERQRGFTAENIRDIAHECMRIGDNEQAEVVFAIANALRDGNLIIQSPAQPPAVPDELTCEDIERLRLALSWEGYSTPESLESCAARWPSLVRDLIAGVLDRKKHMQASAQKGGEA